eukprot:12546369-Alexandrium_andersonii.AAC.1
MNRKTQRAINFVEVGGIYVPEMLLAPPRAGAAVVASGQSSERSECSDGLGDTPLGGEWRTVARKGAAVRGFARQGAH